MNIIRFRLIQLMFSIPKHPLKWFLLIVCLYSLTGCKSIQQYSPEINLQRWEYADVRLLDSIDATEPTQDLMAAYARINDRFVQLRVDFLKMPVAGEEDIYFLFDTNPGGSTVVDAGTGQDFAADIQWDYLIKFPGKGNVSIWNAQYHPIDGMALLIMREPSLESLMLSFNKNTMPINLGTTFLQIFITSPGTNMLLDKTESFSIDAPSPAAGKVLFAFWNSFSSATPAQALRSWAGAHAGPLSSRHGLKYLLNAADQTQTPIMLADLFTPDNLSALDYIGALSEIDELITNGVIYSLNQVMVGNNHSEFSLLIDRKNLLYRYVDFNGDFDYAHFLNNSSCMQLTKENSFTYQTEALLLNCKILLLNNAVSLPSRALVIGGDFSTSFLGDPSLNIDLFDYISRHPWIQIVGPPSVSASMFSSQNLAKEPEADSQNSIGLTADIKTNQIIKSALYKSLGDLPENEITMMAKYIYQSLAQPSPEKSLNLRLNYIGQLGFLVKAAQWVNNPIDLANCDNDLDYDGQNECLLSNSKLFTVIDPNGGYIPFVFRLDSQEVHQIIGPTWEFLVGISDRSEWDNSKGIRSDPGQILGAFADSMNEWNNYEYLIDSNKIVLVNAEMAIRKSISISQEFLRVDINSVKQKNSYYSIPLVVDPWVRYYPDWGDLYYGSKSSNNITWGILSGQMVQIYTTPNMQFYAFNDSHAIIMYDEDPNFDYPRGHYLPFPMSLVQIPASNDFSVVINVKP